jgi:hypothetical protein
VVEVHSEDGGHVAANGAVAKNLREIRVLLVLGCSKKKKIFLKFLFIACDVWEQSEKAGGD